MPGNFSHKVRRQKTDVLLVVFRIFVLFPGRLPENSKFIGFNDRIVTGGETPPASCCRIPGQPPWIS
jgi:hypothetical protein